LVNNRIERDNVPDKAAPNRLCVRQCVSGQRQCANKATCDPGHQISETPLRATPATTKIGPGKNDTGRDDSDANLADPGYCERAGTTLHTDGGTKYVIRNDCNEVSGQGSRIGRKVPQQRGDTGAQATPSRQTASSTAPVPSTRANDAI
jgi:hypothetical protein